MIELIYHTGLVNDYNGWHQVLTANPKVRLSLDHENWLLFFGQPEIKVQRIV